MTNQILIYDKTDTSKIFLKSVKTQQIEPHSFMHHFKNVLK